MATDLKYILLSWMNDLGGKLPYPVESKTECYLDLMETLLLHGYTKEDIFSHSVKNQAIFASHNPNAKKAKGWREVLEKSWDQALVDKWPVETVKHDHEATKMRKDKLAEEAAKKELERKVEYDKRSELQKAEMVAATLAAAKQKEEPEEYVRAAKDMDLSDFEKFKPAVIYDQEMRDFLGFNDNE